MIIVQRVKGCGKQYRTPALRKPFLQPGGGIHAQQAQIKTAVFSDLGIHTVAVVHPVADIQKCPDAEIKIQQLIGKLRFRRVLHQRLQARPDLQQIKKDRLRQLNLFIGSARGHPFRILSCHQAAVL